ncbi:hypothetical protein Cgig2_024909 [Carnegiea gigantea]|uniref:MADS-box domain-containing protein n=1 Tax=Carnegiea gigantea TaxID=171969 RepID=A0A9Q1QI44_9CARY|nr:hypothetical protein Cgig2_024909 [Carnegiea gigantea]
MAVTIDCSELNHRALDYPQPPCTELLLNLICSAMVGRKCKTGQVKCNKELLRVFVRRKAGIMKKAHELSVLCGVPVAVVIFGPDKDAHHVWPQKLENLHGIIGRYLSISPDQRNKSKRATTMSDFVTRKGVEFEQELSYEDEDEQVDEEEVEEGKDTCLVDEINGLLVDLVVNLDAKLEMVNSRIVLMRRAYQYPVEVGSVLNNRQYEEMPLSLSFSCHDQLCSGGSCNPMIGDFVDGSNAGHMGMQEVAPWEKMLM